MNRNGFGENEGGRLKAEGCAPVNTCGKAVVFDRVTARSSLKPSGDRWSFVLLTHASWATVSKSLV
jgi:hypothetical protein